MPLRVSFLLSDGCQPQSPYQLGHIELMHGDRRIRSRARVPDQSHMVLLSATSCLDALNRILKLKRANSVQVVMVDSSFTLEFTEKVPDVMSIRAGKTCLEHFTRAEASEAFLEAGRSLLSLFEAHSDSAGWCDLRDAVADVEGALAGVK